MTQAMTVTRLTAMLMIVSGGILCDCRAGVESDSNKSVLKYLDYVRAARVHMCKNI